MMQIADSLEQNTELYLQSLARMFEGVDPSQLASVEPSRRLFTHLAENRGEIKLVDLKTLIEQDLRLTRKSIFLPIERAIEEKRVAFTLTSTLAEVNGNGRDWVFLMDNMANKLMENKCQLPSWRDVASY